MQWKWKEEVEEKNIVYVSTEVLFFLLFVYLIQFSYNEDGSYYMQLTHFSRFWKWTIMRFYDKQTHTKQQIQIVFIGNYLPIIKIFRNNERIIQINDKKNDITNINNIHDADEAKFERPEEILPVF